MNAHTAKRLSIIVLRLLVACSTFMLTLTVLQRNDSDGYQAAHLAFMPRSSWEMDQGRGMLYNESYYDTNELASLNGIAWGMVQATSKQSPAGLGYEPDSGQGWYATPTVTRGPTIGQTPYVPSAGGTAIFFIHLLESATPGFWQPSATAEILKNHSFGQIDTPTPPPRA